MGLYDLPAIIDFILNVTGTEKLKYVGHSEGTTQLFMAATLEPEYFKSKISVFLALAPVAYMKHIKSYAFQLLA
jgi:lysosomal acid lipase/cholesteryl ester hydrolase